MLWAHGLRLVSSVIERTGYLLLPQWHLTTWTHARLLRALFESQNIDCVLDVGANRGQFRDFLRHEVGYKGLILSFEPISCLAAFCSARTHDPDWHVLACALGDENRISPLHVAKSDELSSFLRPLESGQPFIAESASARIEMVEMKTLDSIFPELQSIYAFNSTFLKIDTQGFDLCVIKGASRTLSEIRSIQTELSVVPIYDNMPSWTEVISSLKRNGFDIAGAFVINRDQNSRIVEFDGVFVKSPPSSAT